MIESLYKQLLQFSSISEGDWNALKVILTEKTILPKTQIIKPGQIADTLYFVAEGAFRSYLLREGEDITDYFFLCVRHGHNAIGCKSRTRVTVLIVSQEQGCRGQLRI